MNATGHYGAALLLYAPLGVLLRRTSPEFALAGGVLVVSLSTLPDWDRRTALASHRGLTHTLPFLAVVAAGCAAAGWCAGTVLSRVGSVDLAAVAGAVATVGVGSHLLVDALTPAGVPLLWPLSGRTCSLSVVRASNPLANRVLLALGIAAAAGALGPGTGAGSIFIS